MFVPKAEPQNICHISSCNLAAKYLSKRSSAPRPATLARLQPDNMQSFWPQKLDSSAVDNLPPGDKQRFFSLLELQRSLLSLIIQLLDMRLPDSPAEGFLQATSSDRKSSVCVQTYQGDKLDLLSTGWAAINVPITTGYTRTTAWVGADIDAPHLSVEIALYGEKALLFVHFIPRKDIIMDIAYLEKYYIKTAPGCQQSLIDLERECAVKERWVAFQSPQPLVRYTSAGLALSFTFPSSELAAAGKVAQEAVHLWLAFVDDAAAVPAEEKEMLARRDAALRHSAVWGDAHFVQLGKVYGEAVLKEMGQLLMGSDRLGSG